MNGTGADKNSAAAKDEKSLAPAKHQVIFKMSRKAMSWPTQSKEIKLKIK
jgi:hypothetical protein